MAGFHATIIIMSGCYNKLIVALKLTFSDPVVVDLLRQQYIRPKHLHPLTALTLMSSCMSSPTLLASVLQALTSTIAHAQSGGFARTCKGYYLTWDYGVSGHPLILSEI